MWRLGGWRCWVGGREAEEGMGAGCEGCGEAGCESVRI